MQKLSVPRILLTLAFLMALLGLGLFWQSQSRIIPAAQAQSIDITGRETPVDRFRSRTCNNGLAAGRYAYTFNGSILGVGNTTAVGVLTVNQDGTLLFADTQSLAGQITRRNFTGTYTLNPDCTGAAIFSTGLTGDFILSDEGREVRVIITTPGVIVSGQAKRIF